MKILIVFIIVSNLYFLTKAQESVNYKGIKFEQNLNWEQIKIKAKKENKYIFMDCYATWCAPCKLMEKNVYTDENVGNIFNDKFISIKVQFDSTIEDNDEVKKWKNDVKVINENYRIRGYPTFLFFSPDGNIVHRDLGFKKVDDFITLGTNATKPDKQYYTLLELYLRGRMDYSVMYHLAIFAKAIDDKDLANAISRDYVDNYLLKLKDADLFLKENIEFIVSFVESSKEKGFDLFYDNVDKIDKLMNQKGYTNNVIDYIIAKEEVEPKVWLSNTSTNPITSKPNWNGIASVISKKYNKDCAKRIVLNAQIRWNYENKNWPELVKRNIEKIEKYGLDTAGLGKIFLNNMIWEVIFLHSNDKKAINKGIKWMKVILQADPNDQTNIDTYSNLLYKIGRTRDAIYWEEKAVKLEEEKAVKSKRVPDKIYQETLAKMRKGERTWTSE